MEPDRALDTALAALGEISANDLEEILQLDVLLPTQASEIMAYNREELLSQFSDKEENLSKTITSCEDESTNSMETSSVLIASQYIENIEVNDSTAENIVEKSQSLKTDLAPSQNAFHQSNIAYLETTFDQEFEQLNECDFQLPLFDEDINASTLLNKDVENMQIERPTTSKSCRKYEFKSKTQLLPSKIEAHKIRNISTSCPNVPYNFHTAEDTAQKNAEQIAAADYIELNCSATSNFQPNKESSIDASDSIESTKSFWNGNQSDITERITKEDEVTTDNISANNLLNVEEEIDKSTTDASGIPSTVKQLFDLMKKHYSDFSFVYAISAQLCQDRVPMSCFVNVKMALLLSIASIGKNSDIAPIPIIVMGNDPYMANYLITSIANLADRFVGPMDNTKPPSSGGGSCNRVWIEADPIQLAKGGVFYAGEWACLKTLRSEKIFKDIETSRVAVENTTRIYPLQTAIWAHWRALKYNSKDQQIFNKFVKIFGIPVYMDSSNHEALVDYILKQASVEIFESTVDHLSISSDDMRKYLAVISARTVDFTHEALNLLQKYFVASRTERPDCLTKQAYTILKQYSESFAKLSLRHDVLTIDVVGAIFLCEHFIQHLYGVGIDPPPTLESVSFVGYVDAHIAKFNEWLQNYVTKYNEKE